MIARSFHRSGCAAAAIAVGMALGLAQAQAADIIYDDTPVAPGMPMETLPLASWTGLYAGITLGYGFGDTKLPGNTIDTDGFIGGLFGGGQYQFDSFVVGVEVDGGYNWMRGSSAGTSAKSGVEGSLRGRIGYAVTDRVLIYGTGGLAVGRAQISNAAGSDSNTMVGWTAGAGVDVKMTEAVFGRIEYRYTDYGKKTFTTGAISQSVDVNQNRIMLGLGVKF